MKVKDTRSKVLFKSAYDYPRTIGETFDYQYKWSWYDENMNLHHDEENQFDKMQSVEVLTSQEYVDRGIIPDEFGGNYIDISDMPTDLPDLLDYGRKLKLKIDELVQDRSKLGVVKNEDEISLSDSQAADLSVKEGDGKTDGVDGVKSEVKGEVK